MRRRWILTAIAVLAVLVAAAIVVWWQRPDTAGAPIATPTTTQSPSPSAPASPTPSATTATPSEAPTASPSPRTSSPTATSKPPTHPAGIPASLRGKDVEYIPTTRRIVALTFDAGANADGVPSILATLAKEHITATFFLTGDFATHFPDAVRSIAAAGHRLGNHTVTHPDCTTLSDAAIAAQITTADAQIRAAGGTSTRPLFRFPFGARDARTIAAVNNTGYVAVRWTVDAKGWQGTSGGMTVQQVIDRVIGAARPGEIVLMHVGSNPQDHTTLDAQALPTVIAQLRARGYSFVTLNALLT